MKLNEIAFDKPLVPFINKHDKSSTIYWQEKNRWLYWLKTLIRATNRYFDYPESNCYHIDQKDFWQVVITCPKFTTKGFNYQFQLTDQQIINVASKYKGAIDREVILAFVKRMEELNS